MDKLASLIEYYLPVYIPVFLTVISVLSGVLTKRIKLTLHALLKIHSDLVLGLFSFVIWALVAFQQTGRIDLNADYSISLIRVVLLLFGNVILLVAGLIVLSVEWEKWPNFGLTWTAHTWENVGNGAFLLVTLVFVFAPIGLAKDRPKPASTPSAAKAVASQQYRVAVPYSDATIVKQVGAGRWANRLLCEISDVAATSPAVARDTALKTFESASRIQSMYSTSRQASAVDVLRDRVVVERREP